MLEVLVETVFPGALEGVAQEGGRPAEEDAAEAFFGEDGAPCGDVGCVDLGVDLTTALDEIEGRYGGVGWSCGRGDVGSIGLQSDKGLRELGRGIPQAESGRKVFD